MLTAGEMLFRLLLAGAAGQLGAALTSRIAPLATVRPLYAFFILLPAGLAFLAIGVPFFLRTLISATRGRLGRDDLFGLAALAACVAGLVVEIRVGGRGVATIAAALAIGLWQAAPSYAEIGRRVGFAIIATAGACLAGLAYYESRHLSGAEPSVAIAPTFVLLAFFFALAGLITTTAAALQRDGDGRIAAAACWLAALTWMLSPLVRAKAATSAAGADRFELWATLLGAAVLAIAPVMHWLRR